MVELIDGSDTSSASTPRPGRRWSAVLVAGAVLSGAILLLVHNDRSGPNACSFLTREEIAATIGNAVSPAQKNTSETPWDGSGCIYPGHPASVLVWSVRRGSPKMFMQQTWGQNLGIGHNIGQRGYQAFSIADSTNQMQSVYVLKHGQYVNAEIMNQTGATPPAAADYLAGLVAQRIR